MPKEFAYTPVKAALDTLAGSIGVQSRSELVDVREGYKRVLAADVTARQDVPVRDTTHFDGFAVQAADLAGAGPSSPVALRITGAVTLGHLPRSTLASGYACRVPTGAFLPTGADSVVPIEEVQLHDRRVVVTRPVRKGDYVFPAGHDVRRGDTLLEKGRELRAQDLVLLASLHFQKVEVIHKPRVAILPTGSELTERIAHPEVGKVVESHSIIMETLAREAGGLPTCLPIVPDDRAVLQSRLRAAVRRHDIVLTLAGTSVGEPDLVETCLNSIGGPGVLVHGVKVHRGRVMGFGAVQGKPVVMLPGPIQGALNAFILFAYPLIRRFLGRGFEEPPSVPATVREDWDASGKFSAFTQIVYVKLERSGTELSATPSSGETEKLSFLVSKDGYIVVPEGTGSLRKGEKVLVHLLPGFSSVPRAEHD